MCVVVHVATDADDVAVCCDQLHIIPLETELDQYVAQKLRRRNCFTVSEGESCGCSFTEYADSRRLLLELLAAYADRGPLDVFLSWDGDQRKEPTLTMTLDRSSLAQIARVLVRHSFMGETALVSVR